MLCFPPERLFGLITQPEEPNRKRCACGSLISRQLVHLPRQRGRSSERVTGHSYEARIRVGRVREELGIARDDLPHIRDLRQKYRGSRYSFGYPACPNLEGQTKLFALLHRDETIGVHLATGFLLEPEQHFGRCRASSRGPVLRSVGGPAAPLNTRCSPR